MDLLFVTEWADEAGLTVTSTLFRALESGEAMRAEEVEKVAARAASAAASLLAVAAMWASSSCSCCRALTNAALSRFVCSAFRAFFTLVVTHCSHITFPLDSLPARKKNSEKICIVYIIKKIFEFNKYTHKYICISYIFKTSREAAL